MRYIHLTDGDEALDFLHHLWQWADTSLSPSPHLILLDLRLPRMDGLEVLKQIRGSEHLCPIPIIVITSSDSPNDISAALNARANSNVVKPSDFGETEQLARDLSEYWLHWDKGVKCISSNVAAGDR